MKKLLCVIVSLFFSSIGLAKPKVILIGVDGMGASGFERASTPTLNRLASEGLVSLDARAVFGTSSGSNWMSMMSGVGPEQHGVLDNGWQPGTSSVVPTVSNAVGGFPTLFDQIAAVRPDAKQVLIYSWKKLPTLAGPASRKELFAREPEDVVAAARKELLGSPDFMLLDFDSVDAMLHTYGATSKQYLDEIAKVDSEIGKLVGDLDDSYTVIITADHGGIGRQHGGYSIEEYEIPLIVWSKELVRYGRLDSPVNIYDAACTALDALQIKRPNYVICKSLLSSADVEISSLDSWVPRPHIDQQGNKIRLYVDHANAVTEYRYKTDFGFTKWLTGASFELSSPAIIEARSRHNDNQSARSVMHTKLSEKNGVQAVLYVGDWSKLPNFNELTPIYQGHVNSISLAEIKAPLEYFGVSFYSFLKISKAGHYQFRMKVDDGGSLLINNQTLLLEPEAKGARFAEGSVYLETGLHSINANYFQTYGDIAFSLEMKAPNSDEFEPVPSHLLFFPQK